MHKVCILTDGKELQSNYCFCTNEKECTCTYVYVNPLTLCDCGYGNNGIKRGPLGEVF